MRIKRRIVLGAALLLAASVLVRADGGPAESNTAALQMAIDRLQLSDAQHQQVDPIVQNYLAAERRLRAEMLAKVKAAVDPAQFEQFRSILGGATTPAAVPSAPTGATAFSDTTRVQALLTGGHDTDDRDRNRPVVLVAAALGVPADVFRRAFSAVHPAPAGEQPDEAQVRQNKQVLIDALGP